MKKLIAVLLTGIVLSGCSSLLTSDKPPPVVYNLKPSAVSEAQASSRKTKPVLVLVSKPVLPPGFESEQIALHLDNGQKLDFYSGAQWAAPLDDLIEKFVVSEAKTRFPNAVIETGELAMPTDYKLVMNFSDFQPVYAGTATTNPKLEVSVTVSLISVKGDKVLRNFTLTQEANAQANTVTAVTTGLSDVLQSITQAAFKSLEKDLK